MKNIKIALWASLLLLSGAWLLADTPWPQPFSYFAFRGVFVQWSGGVAIGAMSIAMLLATRPAWLEARLDGLDKMYRLHKWLGIAALVAGVGHWWFAKGTKWMVGWGWLQRPVRGAQGQGPVLGSVEQWLRDQRGLAEGIGEWSFYAAVVLIVLALLQRFPYRLFVKTHKWLALVYLLLAFHSVVLLKAAYWAQPVGWLVALLLGAGTLSALLVLGGRVGAGRKAAGRIDTLHYYPELDVLESRIALPAGGWRGHRAGQFAFVTSHPAEGAHPYTIASAWAPSDPAISFITKALGDHTSTLRDSLRAGLPVTLEGPYGCFTFDDDAARQIWIGGGIGITPFIARMKQLAASRAGDAPLRQPVDLFHTTRDVSQQALAKMQADAQAAGVRLHVWIDGRDGLLSAERIRAAVPDWQGASFWFCGPSGFGQALRRDFCAHGVPQRRFHQELFSMR
mgnify:CR=1 FL=1